MSSTQNYSYDNFILNSAPGRAGVGGADINGAGALIQRRNQCDEDLDKVMKTEIKLQKRKKTIQKIIKNKQTTDQKQYFKNKLEETTDKLAAITEHRVIVEQDKEWLDRTAEARIPEICEDSSDVEWYIYIVIYKSFSDEGKRLIVWLLRCIWYTQLNSIRYLAIKFDIRYPLNRERKQLSIYMFEYDFINIDYCQLCIIFF